MGKWLHVHVVFLGSAPTQSFNGTRFLISRRRPPVLDRTVCSLLSTQSATAQAFLGSSRSRSHISYFQVEIASREPRSCWRIRK
ncbi:hypothetical protein F5Y05DRAFT_386983 [Hypoxylon sp. FL0543]|nr:hypothetical protein F5Y05DRAFT_386983 [Hypoxylon sp. FL0543]